MSGVGGGAPETKKCPKSVHGTLFASGAAKKRKNQVKTAPLAGRFQTDRKKVSTRTLFSSCRHSHAMMTDGSPPCVCASWPLPVDPALALSSSQHVLEAYHLYNTSGALGATGRGEEVELAFAKLCVASGQAFLVFADTVGDDSTCKPRCRSPLAGLRILSFLQGGTAP